MKPVISINYAEVEVSCRCGNTFTTRSALGKPLRVDVCANCHPAYTGVQKTVATVGRLMQFKRKYRRE